MRRRTDAPGGARAEEAQRYAPVALGSPVPLVGVELGSWPFARIRGELAPGAWEPLELACEDARALLGERTLWAINSTARGGGVAEMQRTLLPYWRHAGLDARWLILTGTPAFFRLTKRLHNLLHESPVPSSGCATTSCSPGPGAPPGAQAAGLISPGDIVVLHDPQTAAS